MLTLIVSWLMIQLGKQGRVVPIEMVAIALIADIFAAAIVLPSLVGVVKG